MVRGHTPSSRAVARLKSLRDELDELPAHPVEGLKGWVTKAKPTIRKDWPDNVADFEQATKIPVWPGYPTIFHANDPVGNRIRAEKYQRDSEAGNAQIAADAKRRMLQFLDGLLATVDDRDETTEPVNLHPVTPVPVTLSAPNPHEQPDPRDVFVVFGRNKKASMAMFDFLRRLGLNPLEWEEMRAATEKGTPFTGEILEKGFRMARAVVVLMTGDDEARLREHLRGDHEPAHERELTPQPRPNVLIEAGMAFGYKPDRTILVELGALRPASDFLGRHVVRLDDSAATRNVLMNRLRTAGCDVRTERTDWLDPSLSFEAAIEGPPASLRTAGTSEGRTKQIAGDAVTPPSDQAQAAAGLEQLAKVFHTQWRARGQVRDPVAFKATKGAIDDCRSGLLRMSGDFDDYFSGDVSRILGLANGLLHRPEIGGGPTAEVESQYAQYWNDGDKLWNELGLLAAKLRASSPPEPSGAE